MPLRRYGRPGLLGSIGRDGVIAGTATMTSHVLQHQPGQLAADQQAAADRQPGAREQVGDEKQAGEALFRSARASAPDLVGQLSELAQLRSSGAITEEEFRSAKTLLLTR